MLPSIWRTCTRDLLSFTASWEGARKSTLSVAPVNSGVYRERICGALLELLLLFDFIALLPLNPEKSLKLSPSPGTVLAPFPLPPPHLKKISQNWHPLRFPGCLLNLELNCCARCISTCLQKARALQKEKNNNNKKRKCRLLNFIPRSSFWRALDLLSTSSGANAAKKKEKRKIQKQRKDQRREILPLVYWTHCIPDFFCKEKLVIKKVSSFSNYVQLIEGPESRCLMELLRGRAQHPRTLGVFFSPFY